MKKYTWGTAVPLIGGLSVAAKQVTGIDPAFFLSYSPFAENELNVKNYFKNTPHYLLDSPDLGGFKVEEHRDVDFVNALCPCAGLSLLSSGNQEQRDKMNRWMLESARFVMSELKPKVFWGENAPGLYSNSGQRVREQFRQIAQANGYSFSIYATNTKFHGIPQDRKRTFYFFWRDSTVPIFEYYKRPTVDFASYLELVPAGVAHHTNNEVAAAERILLENPYVMFLQDKYRGDGISEVRKHVIERNLKGTTILTYLVKTEQLEEARVWLLANGHEKHYREATRVLEKIRSKGGFWDGSFPIYRADGVMSTLISRTLHTIHPTDDRVLTTREALHLMGLPSDFNLVTGVENNICQNVPVTTGSDMVREVVKFINGEATMSNSSFLMQSNHREQIDVQESKLLSF